MMMNLSTARGSRGILQVSCSNATLSLPRWAVSDNNTNACIHAHHTHTHTYTHTHTHTHAHTHARTHTRTRTRTRTRTHARRHARTGAHTQTHTHTHTHTYTHTCTHIHTHTHSFSLLKIERAHKPLLKRAPHFERIVRLRGDGIPPRHSAWL